MQLEHVIWVEISTVCLDLPCTVVFLSLLSYTVHTVLFLSENLEELGGHKAQEHVLQLQQNPTQNFERNPKINF